MIPFLFSYFLSLVGGMKYYRLDNRAPGKISEARGFFPKGVHQNLLDHALGNHLPLSGYVSFTDEEHLPHMIRLLHRVGRQRMWLYSVEVAGNGLPSVADGLRKTFTRVLGILRILEPTFPVIPIDTLRRRLAALSLRYRVGANEAVIPLITEMSTITFHWRVARVQGDYVSTYIPLTAIYDASRISLNADGTYEILQNVTMSYTGPAPAEELSSAATDPSVLNTPMAAAHMVEIRALGGDICGATGALLSLSDETPKCPDYMFEVIVPSGYDFKINYLKEETSTANIHFGQWLQKWMWTNQGKQNMYCALSEDNLRNGTKCQVFGENNSIKAVRPIQGNFNDTGIRGRGWVDVNGDGNVDFCRLMSCESIIMCDVSDGTVFKSDNWTSELTDPGIPRHRWWADVNGDGCADFCRLTDDGMLCNLGSKNQNEVFRQTSKFDDKDWGSRDSRAWVDIEGKGKNSFCRLVDRRSKIRCNVRQENGAWKVFESDPQDGGSPGYGYWVYIDGGPGASFCRVTGSQSDKMQCTSFFHGKFGEPTKFELPAIPKSGGDITFVDLGGRGLLDICVLDEERKLNCKLNLGSGNWSANFSPPFDYQKGLGDFRDANQVVFPRRGDYAAYCRNVGKSTLRCMKIGVEMVDPSDATNASDVTNVTNP